MRKGMKLRKLLLIAVMALSVVMISACSQKKSVLDDVKVKYEGYSGHGIADLDSKKLNSNMVDVFAKKLKLDDYMTEKLKSNEL